MPHYVLLHCPNELTEGVESQPAFREFSLDWGGGGGKVSTQLKFFFPTVFSAGDEHEI